MTWDYPLNAIYLLFRNLRRKNRKNDNCYCNMLDKYYQKVLLDFIATLFLQLDKYTHKSKINVFTVSKLCSHDT